ncbi:MAG: LOG family protein [Candidatus Daviesbacteria bacterium]|nr:LOG family protein [Candidatus Daviesbacteria bacterium]
MDNQNSLKAESISRVAIFGYADAKEGDELFTSVVEVTKALAQTGYIVVDGGGPGVMMAASRGAKLGGGKVIGVTFYPKTAMNFEGRDPKNEIDEEVITHSYVERTLRLLERGQTFVIFNGGTGTISEFGMAWGLARLYFGHHKPLILYGQFWPQVIETLKKNMKIREEELMVFKYANSPQEVLSAIVEFEREIKQGIHKHLRIVGDTQGEGSFTL